MGLGDTNLWDVWNQADTTEGGTYQPPDTYNPTQIFTTSGGGSNFWDALSAAFKGAAPILTARYAVPQLNQGQYIQSGPNGTVLYQGNPTSNGMTIPPLGLSSGISPILLIALGAGAFLLMMKKG